MEYVGSGKGEKSQIRWQHVGDFSLVFNERATLSVRAFGSLGFATPFNAVSFARRGCHSCLDQLHKTHLLRYLHVNKSKARRPGPVSDM